MRHLRSLPGVAVPILLVATGALAALAGIYLIFGLPPALIAGGLAAVVAGLLVDVD